MHLVLDRHTSLCSKWISMHVIHPNDSGRKEMRGKKNRTFAPAGSVVLCWGFWVGQNTVHSFSKILQPQEYQENSHVIISWLKWSDCDQQLQPKSERVKWKGIFLQVAKTFLNNIHTTFLSTTKILFVFVHILYRFIHNIESQMILWHPS